LRVVIGGVRAAIRKVRKAIRDSTRITRIQATLELTGDEIEITPEMMEAGVQTLTPFSFEDRGVWIVAAVYRAMNKARAGLS
jgi:hypothetical protein